MSKIRIGSRASHLAITQTKWVISQLQAKDSTLEVEHVLITTTGDRDQNSSLTKIGGKGVFVKEIEDALLSQHIDLAVHSLKDMPQELPSGLVLGPCPLREDPRDAFISRFGELIEELPRGSTIGTSSPRRKAQIHERFRRRSYSVADLRGNVDTRLKKLQDGHYDGIVLALAGLKRLGLESEVTQVLETEVMLPSPGQGCLALELREGDTIIASLAESIKHGPSDIQARAERAFLQAVGGNCTVPLGLSTTFMKDDLRMKAVLLNATGDKKIYVEETGAADNPELVGAKCAGRLIFEGGSELL